MRMRNIGPALMIMAGVASTAGTVRGDVKAGAYAQDVTPEKFPISVNGNMQDVKATAAHDRIHARCLVIDDGKSVVAFAVVDSCMIPREITEAARRIVEKNTGIPADHVLISATHTHSAPTVTGVFQSDPDADYAKFLTTKIAEGIAAAYKRREPAKIGFGRAREPGQLFNRRWHREHALIPPDPFGNTTDKVQMNPGIQAKGLVESAGPIDPEISMLSVQTAAGKPLALLANYSLHYVGGNPPLSGDYFAEFAERIKRRIAADQKDFVGIMSNGTSGDVNNINFGGPASKLSGAERMKLVAESVAKQAHEAYDRIEHRTDVTVSAAVKDLTLAVRKADAAGLARARKILDEQKGKPSLTGLPAIYARESVLLDAYPDTVLVKIQALRIGSIGIAAIPCEVFTEIGLEIKRKSPLKDTFTIELANGYNGYLPTPAQHRLGGYETWRARSSYLETGASDKITPTVLDLLKTVSAGK